MRYTAFIYGTTYFYWNLFTVHEPSLQKKHLALDRSDFQDLYLKYYQKSEAYIFKGERKNFFTNVTATVEDQSVFIPDPLDDRFYEWVIYILIAAIGFAGHQGLIVLKPWVSGHKLSILRIAFSLGIAPGIIGNGIISSVTYWFWSSKDKAIMFGKDVYAGSLALWVCVSAILVLDLSILIRYAFVDSKALVWKQLEAAKSKQNKLC